MHFIQFLLEHWEGECVKTWVLFMCNFLSALHASQGFETGKSLPKEWDEAVCYFSQVSFSLCTWLVLSLFLFPLLPLCSVPAAQDCVTGTDKVVETLISLSFELPGHSSLFHLETWYRERIPTSVSCKTSRSPGPAIWSQCIEDSAMSQAVWHHCKWEGIVAGDCFERSICCCLQCVSSPTPALGIKFKHCCSLWSQWEFGCCFQWQLNGLPKQQVLTVPQAPGLDGSLGCVGGRALPLFLTLPHTKLCRSQVGQHSKKAACESLPSLSLEIFDLWA